MSSKFIKLSSIKPNEENPRYIKEEKFEKLVNSIILFSKMMEIRPIVVDENNIILGGNMRDKAILSIAERIKNKTLTVEQDKAVKKNKDLFSKISKGLIPESWVIKFDDLTEKEKEEFIIKDNIGFGVWDLDAIANHWNLEDLDDWGFDLPEYLGDVDGEDSFSLPDGDKSPFQQITFTLSDEQAEYLKNALAEAKKQEEYKYIETYGNENSNGNALYYLITQALKTPF